MVTPPQHEADTVNPETIVRLIESWRQSARTLRKLSGDNELPESYVYESCADSLEEELQDAAIANESADA